MGRMKHLSKEERRDLRDQLLADIEAGHVPLQDAVRRMRAVTGLTQAEFAERVAGISLTALRSIEQGHANPRLDTLENIGRHFGLTIGFVRRARVGLPERGA
ncbi:MAG: helix-turn-helix transcriptional regulator [Alphaproteobacteria bacterium]|nr:helix-turn-helix transcriptional regulator [Alphaproteobacteria bacterium]MCB9794254.1 helix-turn-helix transcriptional regulator [Alphaproteobacteria bacterium]